MALAKNDSTSAIADHVKTTGHNILADYHCKIKETLIYSRTRASFQR